MSILSPAFSVQTTAAAPSGAYTLASNALTTGLISAVVCDPDDNTIKELVPGSDIIVHANVAQAAAANFNSATDLRYYTTGNNTDPGIEWDEDVGIAKPTASMAVANDFITWIILFEEFISASGTGLVWNMPSAVTAGAYARLKRDATGSTVRLELDNGGSSDHFGRMATTWPTLTAFGAAGEIEWGNTLKFWYALEGAADWTSDIGTATNNVDKGATDFELYRFSGDGASNGFSAKVVGKFMWNRQLTAGERQSVLINWKSGMLA